jgi:outer membrane receptor protein involved in Fe transport
VGAELSHERGRNDSQLDLGGPIDGSYTIDRTSVGAFAEWLVERGRWLFELGGRVDDPESFDAELSPRAGAVLRLNDGATRLRLAAARAFKLPSFFALASPPSLGGNPALQPEIVTGVDGGVEHRTAGGALSLAANLFFNRYRDLINFDFDTFTLVNEARVETAGVELSAAWNAAERWTLGATVTRQDVDNLDSDDPIRHRPEWYGSARAVWRATSALAVEVDVTGVGERFDEQIPVPERTTVAGYALLGSTLSWRATPRWLVRARADNLLDREYETFIGSPGPGTSARLEVVFD